MKFDGAPEVREPGTYPEPQPTDPQLTGTLP